MSLRKCCLLLASLALVWGAWCLPPVQPEATLRLHVIANSDSPQDQAAKLRVRDAILAYEAQGLDTRSQEALRTDILADGAGLLSTVEASLQESGMDYGARLSLGTYAFPDRTYLGKRYPAGAYPALRVVLGEGAGQNWWCVLFPPLCILELPGGEIEEGEMQSLLLNLLKEGKIQHDPDE